MRTCRECGGLFTSYTHYETYCGVCLFRTGQRWGSDMTDEHFSIADLLRLKRALQDHGVRA